MRNRNCSRSLGSNPAAHVRVIVQKTAPDVGVEALVTRLGGTVTKDLSIIHAFAADLPTSAVATLASAQGVRWISRDGPVVQSGGPDGTVNTTALVNTYNGALNVDKVWAQGYQGSSINVAVVDSGWTNHEDFRATPAGGNMRLLTRVGFNGNETNLDDHNAHGIHVAGIIGGNGRTSERPVHRHRSDGQPDQRQGRRSDRPGHRLGRR